MCSTRAAPLGPVHALPGDLHEGLGRGGDDPAHVERSRGIDEGVPFPRADDALENPLGTLNSCAVRQRIQDQGAIRN